MSTYSQPCQNDLLQASEMTPIMTPPTRELNEGQGKPAEHSGQEVHLEQEDVHIPRQNCSNPVVHTASINNCSTLTICVIFRQS